MQSLPVLSIDELTNIHGGQVNDATAAAKRASEMKKPHSIDIYGYAESERRGVGAEYRQRLNPNTSIFINGRLGTKNDKPDNGVMGGIRFEW